MKSLEKFPQVPGVPQQLISTLNRNVDRLRVEHGPAQCTADWVFSHEDTINSLQVDASGGARTVTLPTPTGNRTRRVIKTDASGNAVTVVGTINGATNYNLSAQYDFVTVEPTGTDWLVVGHS